MWPNALGMLDDMDLFTYIMSVAILCFGPVVPLILNNDTRALILMYHFYHAANQPMQGSNIWWCLERSAVLEVRLRNELCRRGVSVCLEGTDSFAF